MRVEDLPLRAYLQMRRRVLENQRTAAKAREAEIIRELAELDAGVEDASSS
jgi:hypothetical protein